MADFAAARDFVYRQGRVLEQRLFATLFEGASPGGVARALEAFRNDDGGLGHGLEPDKRAPTSHPLDLQFGFEVLDLAGVDSDIPEAAAEFLAGIADERGAIPFLLPSARDYPHAEHLALDVFYAPHAWPTSSMCAWLHRFGVRHAWLDRATEWVRGELEREPPTDAHAIKEALRFVRHAGGDAPTPTTRSTASRRSSSRAPTSRRSSSRRMRGGSTPSRSPTAAGRCAGTRPARTHGSTGARTAR